MLVNGRAEVRCKVLVVVFDTRMIDSPKKMWLFLHFGED